MCLGRVNMADIQAGDLVNFFTTVAMWKRDYAKKSPGLVLEFKPARDWAWALWDKQGSAVVLWSDGAITRENASFLQKTTRTEEESLNGG